MWVRSVSTFFGRLGVDLSSLFDQTVTYAGHYANATGNLSPKMDEAEQKEEQEVPVQTCGRRYVTHCVLI